MKKFLITAFFFLCTSVALAAVDLNTATQAELEKINGIGPKKAQAILEYRTKHGNFSTVNDLQNVSGIGHGKIFQKVKGEFTVGGKVNAAKPGPAMKAIIPSKAQPTAQTAPAKK